MSACLQTAISWHRTGIIPHLPNSITVDITVRLHVRKTWAFDYLATGQDSLQCLFLQGILQTLAAEGETTLARRPLITVKFGIFCDLLGVFWRGTRRDACLCQKLVLCPQSWIISPLSLWVQLQKVQLPHPSGQGLTKPGLGSSSKITRWRQVWTCHGSVRWGCLSDGIGLNVYHLELEIDMTEQFWLRFIVFGLGELAIVGYGNWVCCLWRTQVMGKHHKSQKDGGVSWPGLHFSLEIVLYH